jgi:two-component system, LytTR family, sensor kinase
MFNHRLKYFFVFILSVYTYLNTLFCDVYKYFNLNISLHYAFITIFSITLLTWEGNRIIEKFITTKINNTSIQYRYKQPIAFFIAGIVIAFLATFIVVCTIGLLIHNTSFSENYIPLKLNFIYAFLINLLFHLVNTIFFYFNQLQTKELETEVLLKISAENELQLLKNQINPHFLFNNLNVLSTLVLKKNEDANKFIEEFSKVYRYILFSTNAEMVTLETEIQNIQPYIYLLQKRFEDGVKININLSEKYNHHYIIPASLQLLIENAIKHNIVSKLKPLTIDVYIDNEENLIVKNNLQKRLNDIESNKIGLNNIDKRYEILTEKRIGIIMDENYFKVSLPLIKLNSYASINN